MCTGDNLDTAVAISKEAGIITDEDLANCEEGYGYVCMEGKQFKEVVGGLTEKVDPANPDQKIESVKNKQAFR